MSSYRKRPVTIEAIQYLGTPESNLELREWIGEGIIAFFPGNAMIETLEGDMIVGKGDWVIKEPYPTADRQFYPCKNEIFMSSYDEVGVVKEGLA